MMFFIQTPELLPDHGFDKLSVNSNSRHMSLTPDVSVIQIAFLFQLDQIPDDDDATVIVVPHVSKASLSILLDFIYSVRITQKALTAVAKIAM